MKVISYCRVSTEEQAESGLGLDAQRAAVEGAVAQRGWTLVHRAVDEGISAKTLDRPALQDALERLDRREADALVVAKLDRLSRSLLNFCQLRDRAARAGWCIVTTDFNVDMTTSHGKLVANVMGSVAEWERDIIGERTRAALRELKARGVRLGRPIELDPSVRRRITELRSDGLTLQQIAARLRKEGVPTARGGQWRPSTIAAVLRSIQLDTVSPKPGTHAPIPPCGRRSRA